MSYLLPLEDLIKTGITTMVCTDLPIRTLVGKLDIELTPKYIKTGIEDILDNPDPTKLYVIKDDYIDWEKMMNMFYTTTAHIIVWKDMNVAKEEEEKAEVYIPKNGSYAIKAVFYAYEDWVK